MYRVRVYLLIVSVTLSHARILGSPEPIFTAYCPKGLAITLPDEHYMGHIQFIFRIDKPGNSGQYEYYANREVYEKKGGAWIYEDKNISLSHGQTLFYKINQIINPSMKRTLYEGAHIFQYILPLATEGTEAPASSTDEIKINESSSVTPVDDRNLKDILSSANAKNCSFNPRSSSRIDNSPSNHSTSSSSDNCRCSAQSLSESTQYSPKFTNIPFPFLELEEKPDYQTLVDGKKLNADVQEIKMKLDLLTKIVLQMVNQTQVMHSTLQKMAAEKNFSSSSPYTQHLRHSESLNGYRGLGTRTSRKFDNSASESDIIDVVRPSPASTTRLWFSARYYSQTPHLACTLFKWLFPDCARIDSHLLRN